jgi:hypothetical protein
MSSERILEFKEKVFWTPISFDADGVLVGNQQPLVDHVNKVLKTNYRVEDIDDWNCIIKWALAKGWDLRDAKEFEEEVINNPEIGAKSMPALGASEFMHRLYMMGLRPFVLTARRSNAKELTFTWFKRWMPWLTEKQILIRENGSNISDDDYKALMIKQNHIVIHVEDSFSQAKRILSQTKAVVILVPRLYNMNHPKMPGLIDFPYEGHLPNLNDICGFLINENKRI